MTDDINRVPLGVVGAGRFAPNPPKAESPVRLFDRNDGSYAHPSPSSTAEHCIDFWSNVTVPDEIITQVENAYYNDRVREIDEDMEISMSDWSNRWVDENPAPAKQRDVEAYNQRYRDDHEVYRLSILPEVTERRPENLGNYDSRQIIRAAQMVANRPSPDRFPEESEKVLNHEVELFNETLTVREIELKYRMGRIKGYLSKVRDDGSHAATIAAMESTNQLLENISSTLVHQRLESRASSGL